MKKHIDIIRLLIISPEFCFFLLVLFAYFVMPDWLVLVGQPFKENTEIWKYLPTLPILFTSVVIKIGAKIRSPHESTSNKILYEWPQYYRLKNRVLFSIFINIGCSLGALTIWFFTKSLSPITIGAIYLLSIGISGLTALCMVLALPNLKEILGEFEE